jgi:tetratricopeptide (TPR) repeat protein
MAAPPLDALKKDVDRAIKAGDPEKIALAWRAIATGHPDTSDAAEAEYRLGLDALFRVKNMDQAGEHFRTAAKAKGVYAMAARSSLGLVLLRQGKPQQGIFELRKVAGTAPPTILSASAWGLLVVAFRESNNAREAERARTEHRRALQKLIESNVAEDSALANFMLGMEHKHDGERAPAKKLLQTALDSGKLPPAETAAAQKALAEV